MTNKILDMTNISQLWMNAIIHFGQYYSYFKKIKKQCRHRNLSCPTYVMEVTITSLSFYYYLNYNGQCLNSLLWNLNNHFDLSSQHPYISSIWIYTKGLFIKSAVILSSKKEWKIFFQRFHYSWLQESL